MNEKRQRLVLGALIAVFAVVIAVRVLPALRGGGDNWWQQGASSVELDDNSRVEVVELHAAHLAGSPAEFVVGRDPWRYGQVAPKPQPKPEPVKRPPPKPAPTAPVEVVQTPVEPQGPLPPEVDVTFLGTFGPANRQIAVFYDGESIFNAGRGDVLNEKFQVVEIGLESVDLGFVGFPDEPPARLAIGG